MLKFKSAFTLVELLVVIAIIGLLSSIVSVVTSGLRGQADIAKTLAWARSVQSVLGSSAAGIWNMDEGIMNTCSDGKDLCDVSGWGNNGTVYGSVVYTTETPSGQGQALSFGGVDSYVDCGGAASGSSLDLRDNFTIEAWVKGATTDGTIVERVTGYSIVGVQYILRQNGTNAFYLVISNGINWVTASWSIAIETGKWYHIVATYDGTNGKIYGDGVLKHTSSSLVAPLQYRNTSVKIGGIQHRFNNIIDGVRIYNTSLSLAQIQSQYYLGLDKLLIKGSIDEEEHRERIALK